MTTVGYGGLFTNLKISLEKLTKTSYTLFIFRYEAGFVLGQNSWLNGNIFF